MKLYKISQNVNNGYDTYDAFIVSAENEDTARLVRKLDDPESCCHSWVKDVKDIKVEYLGEADPNLMGGEEGIIAEI